MMITMTIWKNKMMIPLSCLMNMLMRMVRSRMISMMLARNKKRTIHTLFLLSSSQ